MNASFASGWTANFLRTASPVVALRFAIRRSEKLASFRSFEIAEKALTENLDALDRLSAPDAQQAQMHETMTKALEDLEEGLEAARRMALDRCGVRERVSV